MLQCAAQDNNEIVEEGVKAGDVVYYANSKLNTCKLDDYSTSLGNAVGVIVIPPGILPDGKARMISLNFVNYNGSAVTNTTTYAYWYNKTNTDSSLTNYTLAPILTTNDGSTNYTTAYGGYLPSDNFTGDTCYTDNIAKYNVSVSNGVLPSPYNGDELNSLYTVTISGNNVLSDFNGYNNTTTLYSSSSSNYRAARGCYLYSDGYSTTKWHLPSAGELCFLLVRSKVISDSITAVGGVSPYVDRIMWSSTEYSKQHAYVVNLVQGFLSYQTKTGTTLIRPFATIEL